jgi:hypothetical protein
MLERLKRALVESFVGVIAVGWLFAQAGVHFANVIVAPIVGWMARRQYQYQGVLGRSPGVEGFTLQDAVPDLIRSSALFLIAYILLRWLYFPKETSEVAETPDPGTSGPGTSDPGTAM